MSKKSLTKNYIYNLIYQILTLVLPLITTPYVCRVLGAEAIGVYSYTYNTLSYFLLFGALGVALYGQREIAYVNDDISKRKKVFLEIFICRFTTIAIAIIFYYFFLMRTGEYRVYYSIWALELVALAFDITWFFHGLEEFKRTVTRNVIVRLVSVALIFIIVKSPQDLIKYITIYAIADLVGNLLLWVYVPKYIKGVKIDKIHAYSHIPAILLLFIPQIATQIYNLLDKTMIGRIIVDKSEVGFYEQGQKVIRVLLTLVTSLGIVMIPRMANTFASGDKEKVYDYMKKSFKFVFFLAFPIVFGLMSVSSIFVPLFFGPGYEKVIILINVISPTILLTGMANVIGTQYLLPTKRQREYTISITIGLIVNFILNYILITLFNSIGASIATVLSELVVVAAQFYMIKKDVQAKAIVKLSYTYLFAGIIMLGASLSVKVLLGPSLKAMAIQVIVGILVYVGMLWSLQDEYLKLFFDKAKSILIKK